MDRPDILMSMKAVAERKSVTPDYFGMSMVQRECEDILAYIEYLEQLPLTVERESPMRPPLHKVKAADIPTDAMLSKGGFYESEAESNL